MNQRQVVIGAAGPSGRPSIEGWPARAPLQESGSSKWGFQAAGAKPRIGAIGRGSMRLLALFASDARELVELMYEFERPLVPR